MLAAYVTHRPARLGLRWRGAGRDHGVCHWRWVGWTHPFAVRAVRPSFIALGSHCSVSSAGPSLVASQARSLEIAIPVRNSYHATVPAESPSECGGREMVLQHTPDFRLSEAAAETRQGADE